MSKIKSKKKTVFWLLTKGTVTVTVTALADDEFFHESSLIHRMRAEGWKIIKKPKGSPV